MDECWTAHLITSHISHRNWGASLALDFTFSQFCAEAGGRLHSHDRTQAVNMVFRFIIQSDLCGCACSVWKSYPSCFKLFFLLFSHWFFSPQDFTLSPAFGDSLYVIWAADHFPSRSHKHIMVKELHLFPMQHYFLLKQKQLLVSVSSRKKNYYAMCLSQTEEKNYLDFQHISSSSS